MRILMGAVLALIVYGSFFPFDYVPHRPTLADAIRLFLEWPQWVSLVDAAGNMLLFLPLGLCVPAVAARCRARLAWVLGAIVLAWTLQYGQFWFPSRDPSGSDAWFNTLGVLLGFALGLRTLHVLQRHAARLAAAPSPWPVATVLLLAWVAYRWFPLVPHFDINALRHALWPLVRAPTLEPVRVLHDAAAWLLWFLLLRYSPWHPVSGRLAAAVAVGVLCVEPFFWFSVVTASNVAGLLLALLLRPWILRGPMADARVFGLVLASIVATGLTPWPSATVPRPFFWIPFAGLLLGNMLGNTAVLFEKCFMYGGAVLLLSRHGLPLPASGLLLAVGLTAIEWAQRYSPGRTPELTDPLLALLMGVLFHAVLQRPDGAGRSQQRGDN